MIQLTETRLRSFTDREIDLTEIAIPLEAIGKVRDEGAFRKIMLTAPYRDEHYSYVKVAETLPEIQERVIRAKAARDMIYAQFWDQYGREKENHDGTYQIDATEVCGRQGSGDPVAGNGSHQRGPVGAAAGDQGAA